MRLMRFFSITAFVLSAAVVQGFAQTPTQSQKESSLVKKVSFALGEDKGKEDQQGEGTALIIKLGEEQISYLQEFLKATGRDWSIDEFQ